jgi:hypothetical protein
MRQEFYHTHRLPIAASSLGAVVVLGGALWPFVMNYGEIQPYLPYIVLAAVSTSILSALSHRLIAWTIVVDEDNLVGRFGPMMVRRQIGLSDISRCVVISNKWYAGWGVAYNGKWGHWRLRLKGFDTVELTLKDGSHLRVTTPEAVHFTTAIGHPLQIRPH